MSDFFTDLATAVISKSLDASGIRHRVIANNIANVETPGFTRSEVSFETRLKEVMATGDQESMIDRIGDIEPDVKPDMASPARPDGNNVSVDKEMADMVKNTLQYESLVQLLEIKGSMVRSAINEGRR